MCVCGFMYVEAVNHNKCGTQIIKDPLISLQLPVAVVVTSKSIDYDSIDGNNNNAINFQSTRDYQDADYDLNANNFEKVGEAVKRDPENYQLAFENEDKKRNILSALRTKMRRSEITDAEEKYKFAPVLSVGKLKSQIYSRNLSIIKDNFNKWRNHVAIYSIHP